MIWWHVNREIAGGPGPTGCLDYEKESEDLIAFLQPWFPMVFWLGRKVR